MMSSELFSEPVSFFLNYPFLFSAFILPLLFFLFFSSSYFFLLPLHFFFFLSFCCSSTSFHFLHLHFLLFGQVSPFKSKLMIVYQTYQDMMNKFLLMLNNHSDDNLKFLSFRLDFNEFYKSKEPKIRTSLCFRQSVSSPTNTAAPAAAAHLRHPNHPPPQPTPAAHHASMDKINAGQTEKRHRGLSSL